MRWLLYGAYGYTGRLVGRRAVEVGEEPILAGRDPDATAARAAALGLEHRSFALGEPDRVEAELAGVELVLNAAGPFSRTFEPMVRACLSRGCHYLDVTGEIAVFEAAYGLDERAREVGALLLPGVGLDVAPSDCLAVRTARRVSRPTHLDLALHSTGGTSPGTARSVVEGLARPGKVRRDGRIVDVRHGSVSRRVPFGDRERHALCIPWGDVSTAYRSTGVPNIRVFASAPRGAAAVLPALAGLLRLPGARGAASWLVGSLVSGPSEEERAGGGVRLWCEAWNDAGESARLEVVTPDGYTFTARSAVAAVRRVAEGRLETPGGGFRTPATAFGAGFVDEIPGVAWARGAAEAEARERSGGRGSRE